MQYQQCKNIWQIEPNIILKLFTPRAFASTYSFSFEIVWALAILAYVTHWPHLKLKLN